jgi:hypothetical protein
MKYKIEPIGAQFSNKDITNLEGRFNKHSESGYRFHSVFQIQKPGCMGIGTPTVTYLAVYVKD